MSTSTPLPGAEVAGAAAAGAPCSSKPQLVHRRLPSAFWVPHWGQYMPLRLLSAQVGFTAILAWNCVARYVVHVGEEIDATSRLVIVRRRRWADGRSPGR